jgi:hypothetical protein
MWCQQLRAPLACRVPRARRGLYMLNLVQQSRYLSSNSGGSWFNSAFSYQVRASVVAGGARGASAGVDVGKVPTTARAPARRCRLRDAMRCCRCCRGCMLQSTVPVAEFLGPYIPPQNLTRDAMRGSRDGKQGAFAATIANAVIKANALVGERMERPGWRQHPAAAAALTRGAAAAPTAARRVPHPHLLPASAPPPCHTTALARRTRALTHTHTHTRTHTHTHTRTHTHTHAHAHAHAHTRRHTRRQTHTLTRVHAHTLTHTHTHTHGRTRARAHTRARQLLSRTRSCRTTRAPGHGATPSATPSSLPMSSSERAVAVGAGRRTVHARMPLATTTQHNTTTPRRTAHT